MIEIENDGLPPWPQMPEGWNETAIVPRRTTPLYVSAIVFVETETRVYRKARTGYGSGGPIARYRYQVRKIAGETRVSWLLAWRDGQLPEHMDKVPKRDLSKIFGRDDVEEALWIGANAHKIASIVTAMRHNMPNAFDQLQAIAKIIGFKG